MNSLKKYLSWAIIFSITTTSYSPPFPGDSLGLKFEFLDKLPSKKDIIGALSKKPVAALIAPLALLGLAIKYDPNYKAAELITLCNYIYNQMNEKQMQKLLTSLNIQLNTPWKYDIEDGSAKLELNNTVFDTISVLNTPPFTNERYLNKNQSLHPYAFIKKDEHHLVYKSGYALYKLLLVTHPPGCKHPECAKRWDSQNPYSFAEFKKVWFTALRQTFGAYYKEKESPEKSEKDDLLFISVSLAHNNIQWLQQQEDKPIITVFNPALKSFERKTKPLQILGLVPDPQNKFTGNNHWGLALMMIRDAIKTAPKNSHLKIMINYLRLRLNPFNFGIIHSDLPEIMKQQ